MPNIKIIGENEPSQKKKVPIKFEKVLNGNGVMDVAQSGPADFENIELICKNYTYDGRDLIFCYTSNRNNYLYSAFFIGRWNDGVV